MNRSRARIYTLIRERYWELTRDGMSQAEAIEEIALDPSVNPLGYSQAYIKDIVSRINHLVPRGKNVVKYR